MKKRLKEMSSMLVFELLVASSCGGLGAGVVLSAGVIGLCACSSESEAGAENGGRTGIVCGPGTFEEAGECLPEEGGADAATESSDDGAGIDAFVSDNPADIPERVGIPAGSVNVDFTCAYCESVGSADVSAFRITKTPITVAQMRRCVEAGACTVPSYDAPQCLDVGRKLIERANYETGNETPDVPVTCVSPRQASTFCKFAGDGRLPIAEEWLLAARGSVAQTYPWGESNPTCEQHPLAHLSFPDPVNPADKCCRGDACDAEHFTVGRRPQNASVYGVLDILMTAEELIGRSDETLASNCRYDGGCRVFWQLSWMAGSINGFFPLKSVDAPPDSPLGGPDPDGAVYSFRCVWEGEE